MGLYGKYFIIHLKSQMQYKASFFLTLLGQALTTVVDFVGVYLLLTRFHTAGGFTVSEVMLCFAVVLMAFSTSECFARGFDRFPTLLGNGQFDRAMTRPRGLILQVLGSQIEFARLGRFVQALVMFAFVLPRCGVSWTADKILTLALMILGGIVAFSGLFVIYASICFFTTEGLEFMNIFTDGGREFGSYPFSVYGEGILKFFTYVVPLALFQYYPLLYLLGRTDNRLYMLTPLCEFLFLIPCLLFWRFGVRHFRSTGS